jgi:osomolarity two-component system response regulator SSK1
MGPFVIIHKPVDLIMPVMSGAEATREIRRIEAERQKQNDKPPIDSIIIALTASTLTEDHQVAMKAGCNDFILKPVSLRWLERKVREWGNIQGVIDYENLEEAISKTFLGP